MLGIDIYNGTRESGFDLARVKAAGYGFTIVKATEGVQYTDPSFAANVTAARTAGLLVGAYHLMRATPIEQQAHDFIAAISGRGPYCCLAIDVEDVGGPELSSLGKAAITDRILTIYRVRADGRWLPEVQDTTDFAGLPGKPITDVAMRVSAGTIKYRVHVLNGKWLPWVTACDINRSDGYAGDGHEIDALQVIYYTPEELKPSKCAKYRVAPVGNNYYPWQIDNQTTGGQDGYAGIFGQTMDRLQMCVE